MKNSSLSSAKEEVTVVWSEVFRTCVQLFAGASLVHVVPLLVRTLPLVPGATKVGVLVPAPRMTLFAVSVVRPVPPLATISVPAIVIVPDVVMGPPDVVRPVVPPLMSTLVTVPVPATASQAGTPAVTVRT